MLRQIYLLSANLQNVARVDLDIAVSVRFIQALVFRDELAELFLEVWGEEWMKAWTSICKSW